MKRIFIILAVVVSLASCQRKELTDIDLNTFVYMPQANQLSRKIIDISLAFDTTYYGASVNGFAPPSTDVEVVFSANEQALEQFNTQHETSYLPLPTASYSLVGHAVINSGKTNTKPLQLVVDLSHLEPFMQYLLPITVTSPNASYRKESGNNTSYFLFDLIPNINDYARYDNSQWAIVAYSSHDPWEGGPDGNVHSLLNENGDSYWITQYGKEGPHWVVVDMKEEKDVHGVTYMNRKFYPWHPEPQGFPKHITLEISNDGEQWENVLTVADIPFPEGEVKDVWVSHFSQSFKTARYFRFTALETHSRYSPQFNLSCLSIF